MVPLGQMRQRETVIGFNNENTNITSVFVRTANESKESNCTHIMQVQGYQKTA